MADISTRFEGKRNVRLSFSRSGDSRVPPTMILTITDSDMAIIERLEMDPKQFADMMSGLATWVDDYFAGHRG